MIAPSRSTSSPVIAGLNLAAALTLLLQDTGHTVCSVTVRCNPVSIDQVPDIQVVVLETWEGSAWLLGLNRRSTETSAGDRCEVVYRGVWQRAKITLCAPLAPARLGRDSGA